MLLIRREIAKDLPSICADVDQLNVESKAFREPVVILLADFVASTSTPMHRDLSLRELADIGLQRKEDLCSVCGILRSRREGHFDRVVDVPVRFERSKFGDETSHKGNVIAAHVLATTIFLDLSQHESSIVLKTLWCEDSMLDGNLSQRFDGIDVEL